MNQIGALIAYAIFVSVVMFSWYKIFQNPHYTYTGFTRDDKGRTQWYYAVRDPWFLSIVIIMALTFGTIICLSILGK